MKWVIGVVVGLVLLGCMALGAILSWSLVVQPLLVRSSSVGSQPPAAPNASPALVTGVCPTEREFKELTGVTADIDRTEPCSFHWRGDPQTFTAARPCPTGWICTLGTNDQNVVYQGDNNLQSTQLFAGTWRLISMYPEGDEVHNNCSFLKKVQAEGAKSDPKWTATAGNFVCP